MNNIKETPIENLWAYACCGDLKKLKEYYKNGGETNRRYYAIGSYHSLIAGAYRNENYETVKFLLSVGETIIYQTEKDIDIWKFYLNIFMRDVEKIINYFENYNGNSPKNQLNVLYELKKSYYKLQNILSKII